MANRAFYFTSEYRYQFHENNFMLERQVDSYDVTKWNYATVGVQLS
jgi:hypothetical protein